jgi:hypothetical protein
VNTRHSVAGKIGTAAAGAGAVAGFAFVALFLGGNLRVVDFEWLGLVPLIAWPSSGILWRYSRGRLSRSELIAGLSFLALWTAAAVVAH